MYERARFVAPSMVGAGLAPALAVYNTYEWARFVALAWGVKLMPSLEGTSLGRYRLTRRLGRGGMSEVYLAYDELMNREVAVKVVSSTHADYIERFQREAEAIGRLQHDHILPAY